MISKHIPYTTNKTIDKTNVDDVLYGAEITDNKMVSKIPVPVVIKIAFFDMFLIERRPL